MCDKKLEVRKAMDMSKVNAASTTESVDAKFCVNKKSEEVGFMDNAKVYMKSWVNASVDDHKACFKASWNRVCTYFAPVNCFLLTKCVINHRN